MSRSLSFGRLGIGVSLRAYANAALRRSAKMIVSRATEHRIVSTFFVGFCAGIGAMVAVSVGLGVVMLLKAADADDDGSFGVRPAYA